MSTKHVISIGFFMSLVILFILASGIEGGDTNAVSMYFVVFLVPVLVLVLLNALYLRVITKLTNKTIKALLCVVPVIILSFLSLIPNLTIESIDGNLAFVAKIGAIAFGITNILWLIRLFKPKSA
jgi:hypothetical protein